MADNQNITADEATLEPTEARCLECGAVFQVEDGETADMMCEPCDESGDDPYMLEFFHVTDVPLGFSDDEDYHVNPNGTNVFVDRWEYPAEGF